MLLYKLYHYKPWTSTVIHGWEESGFYNMANEETPPHLLESVSSKLVKNPGRKSVKSTNPKSSGLKIGGKTYLTRNSNATDIASAVATSILKELKPDKLNKVPKKTGTNYQLKACEPQAGKAIHLTGNEAIEALKQREEEEQKKEEKKLENKRKRAQKNNQKNNSSTKRSKKTKK